MKHPTYSIQAGNFKAKCFQIMDEVKEKHITIIITKHGKPVAKISPVDNTPIDFFGCMKDTVTIKKDIISPIDVKWGANE